MRSIFVIFFSAFSVAGFSQMGNVSDVSLAGKPLMVDANPRFSGSAYLESKWSTGNIKMNNEHTFEGVPVRYNVFEDVPEFNRDGQAFALDPFKVREFSYLSVNGDGSKKYAFKNGFSDIPGYGPKNYFEVLFEGKVSLLKKHVKQIINDPSATYGSVASKVIQDSNTLYFRTEKGDAGTFKANKKGLMVLFPGNEKAIEEYVKSNKLTYKFDRDLALIFAFADTL